MRKETIVFIKEMIALALMVLATAGWIAIANWFG